VFLAGKAEPTGGDYFSSNPVVLEYDPHGSASTLPLLNPQPTFPAQNQTWQSAFMLLPTGQLLLSMQTNTLHLYTPDPADGLPHPSWRPAHISVPSTLAPGQSHKLHGTQLNGLSQAVSYGDDAGMATNYPIVRLTKHSTGQVVYLKSHDFSTMGIATGRKVPHDMQNCIIDIPASISTGHWDLVVIANGIPSESHKIHITAHPHPSPVGGHPHHHFEGKVESIAFNRFGHFKSFTIESGSGERKRIESHDLRIAELVRQAMQDRLMARVWVEPHKDDVLEKIEFFL
jgi:hypothetical protein